MAKPVILAVDDDVEVLRAVARDLRSKYAEQYRIMRASSGEEALDALRELRLVEEPVALLLVDQRMPGMTGVEFLEKALEHYPKARRALLTAYADTDAAIRAINEVHIDYYLMKPWDPPELNLYPVLDDMLDDWSASYKPAFQGVRLIGHRWSPEAHRARDFLARNQVPYQWYELGTDSQAEELLRAANATSAALPLLLLTDGPCWNRLPTRPSPNASACTGRRSCRCTTSSSSEPVPPGWPRPCTAPPRASRRRW